MTLATKYLNILRLSIILVMMVFFSSCGVGQWFKDTFPLDSSQKKILIPQPPGEKEFLDGKYQAAAPLLSTAAQGGNLRAIFFMRIIYQHGLDGGAVQPELAKKSLDYLALRYSVLTQLLVESPREDRALYRTALATLYFLGRTPQKIPNISRAIDLASPAAEANFGPAVNLMTALGLTSEMKYQMPDQSTSGPENSFKLAQSGANRQDILAMGNLASLYRRGLGVTQNQYHASSWAYAATKTPIPSVRAQNDMGFFYEQGLALTTDIKEATRWYGLAAARNYPLAKANLERLKNKAPGPPKASDDIDY